MQREFNRSLERLAQVNRPLAAFKNVCAVFGSDAHYSNKETSRNSMANDNELLREYARSASETAFAELVNRHVNMVYSAALRQVDGDVHSTQELTQMVFVELGCKASSLVRHPALAGWRYTCVRWMAANARRAMMICATAQAPRISNHVPTALSRIAGVHLAASATCSR